MTQAYNISQMANNLNSSGQLDATDGLVNAVPVANGGTGASSVAAAVSNLSASIYPVGSIYINAAVATNPATLLGFGTWSAFGSGRVLVGVNPSDSAFDTLGETGGSKDSVVVSHTHGISTTVTDPGHSHALMGSSSTGASRGLAEGGSRNVQGGDGTPGRGYVQTAPNGGENYVQTTATGLTVDTTISATGVTGTNANLQPYVTVYMWVRTA